MAAPRRAFEDRSCILPRRDKLEIIIVGIGEGPGGRSVIEDSRLAKRTASGGSMEMLKDAALELTRRKRGPP
jgi:hypothetical protein